MATTAKTVNYTPEQTEKLKASYLAGVAVSALAVEFGKSVKSITAKLSREGVYKAKEYVSKTGEKPVKKDEHATVIAEFFGMNANDADSLTKANKSALKLIADHVKSQTSDSEAESE